MSTNAPMMVKVIIVTLVVVGIGTLLALLPGCDFGPGPSSTSHDSSRILHADESSFDQHVLQSRTPVLVDFYADWCGPCQMLTPVLEELARETPSAKVVKINVDQSRELVERYGINAIPSVMVFRNGKLVSRYTGLANKAQLQSMLSM